VGTEQQRMLVVEEEFEPRQEAGIGMKQTVRVATRRADVAVVVGDDEGVAVFQGTARPRRRPGRRNIKRCLSDWYGLSGIGLKATLRHRGPLPDRTNGSYRQGCDRGSRAALGT